MTRRLTGQPASLLDLFSPVPTYAPRTWQEGDQVLHAHGPKHKEMLLVVLGYHSNTHARCRYVYTGYAGNKDARKNPTAMVAIQIIAVRHLLDPGLFGITVKNPRHESTPEAGTSQTSHVFTGKLIFNAHNCANRGHVSQVAEAREGADV